MGGIGAEEALARLAAARFVPVLRAPDAARAEAAARALLAGGCRAVEIALTTPGAAEAIVRLAADGVVVGAGTVMDAAAAEAMFDAGAAFVVSPHLALDVVAAAQARGALAMPGALTPTEIVAAMRAGAPAVKVYPAAAVGGPAYLRLVRDPLPGVRFFPTGGVTLADAPAYLAAGAVAVGVASALAPQAAIAAGDAATLTARAREWAAALGLGQA